MESAKLPVPRGFEISWGRVVTIFSLSRNKLILLYIICYCCFTILCIVVVYYIYYIYFTVKMKNSLLSRRVGVLRTFSSSTQNNEPKPYDWYVLLLVVLVY